MLLKAAGRLPFHVPHLLLKSLLQHRETPVVVLHLVAEKQLADLIDARRVGAPVLFSASCAALRASGSMLGANSGFAHLNGLLK